jgi:hypothetical protein
MYTRGELRDLIWRLTKRLIVEVPPRLSDPDTADLIIEGMTEGRKEDLPEVIMAVLAHEEPDGIQ